MYSITTTKFGDFDKLILKNEMTQEYVAVVPSFGCNVNEVVLSNGIQNFDIVDGDASPEELLINKGFKGCKLVPYPNRIKQGIYSFEGRKHRLPVNDGPNALHGLVLYQPFQIIASKANENEAELITEYAYNQNDMGYPFCFKLQVSFLLNKNGLTKTTQITNSGEGNMPVGDGWHLYFKCKSKIDDCILLFDSEKIVINDTTLIPTGQTQDFDCFKTSKVVDNFEFDDCFILSPKNNIAEVVLTDKVHNLSIVSWQETGNQKYNYLQIYTPPHRNSIAIEPMTCQPNAFNNTEGLITLKPLETISITCGIRATTAQLQ